MAHPPTEHLGASGALRAATSIHEHDPGALNLSARHQRALLPAELLCCVWQDLPLGDRVAVTQVCRKWREISLHSRALWTRLDFYTTRHHGQCACDVCAHRDPLKAVAPNPSGWDASPYPANASNEHLIRRVLALSGDLELQLVLNVVPYVCDDSALVALGAALSSHSARIAHILCVTSYPHVVAHILLQFASLPALRTIRMVPGPGCDLEDYWPRGACTTLFLSLCIELPRLELLDIRDMPRVEWPLGSRLRLPALRALSLRVGRMRNLVYAMNACPGLASLRIVLDDDYKFEWTKQADDMLRAIPSCRLDGLRAAHEHGWLLATFRDPARQSLTLEFLNLPGEQAFGVLRDVGPSAEIQLVVQERNGVVVVKTDAADGRTRQLVFPVKDRTLKPLVFQQIWADTALLEHVRHISVDGTMWAPFIATIPSDNSLERIDFTVSKGSVFPGSIVADVLPATYLPRLTFLSVIGGPGAACSVPAAADIEAFVRGIGAPLPLRTLMLDRRFMPHGPVPVSPETFAQCICV